MKSSWTKLGVSVGFIAAVAACTVTTGPFVPDEGGIFGDGGKTDGSVTGDTGTGGDSSSSDGGMCTLVVTLNNATCTSCMQASCCDSVNACFKPTSTGAESDCSLLQTCINNAITANPADGGGDAGGRLRDDIQTCRDAHPASVGLENAWVACLSAHCQNDCK